MKYQGDNAMLLFFEPVKEGQGFPGTQTEHRVKPQ